MQVSKRPCVLVTSAVRSGLLLLLLLLLLVPCRFVLSPVAAPAQLGTRKQAAHAWSQMDWIAGSGLGTGHMACQKGQLRVGTLPSPLALPASHEPGGTSGTCWPCLHCHMRQLVQVTCACTVPAAR